jgi:LEA14-like dessication related protein
MRRTTIAYNSLKILMAFALSACSGLQRDPLQVTVADIESLPGEGLEMRMLVKLRVQNPNDAPIEYNGVYLKLDVLDKPFATGVSDESGSVPRFGESIVSVPLTVSTLHVVLGAVGMLGGGPIEKVRYRMEGKLSGSAFSSTRFQADGELALPSTTSPKSTP